MKHWYTNQSINNIVPFSVYSLTSKSFHKYLCSLCGEKREGMPLNRSNNYFCFAFSGTKGDSGISGSGTTSKTHYTRWGSRTCEGTAQLVYEGNPNDIICVIRNMQIVATIIVQTSLLSYQKYVKLKIK